MKLSAGKTSQPGAKQVHRGPDGDVLAQRDEPPPPGHEHPLVPVMRDGLAATTARALRDPELVPVRISEQLKALHDQVASDLKGACSM